MSLEAMYTLLVEAATTVLGSILVFIVLSRYLVKSFAHQAWSWASIQMSAVFSLLVILAGAWILFLATEQMQSYLLPLMLILFSYSVILIFVGVSVMHSVRN